MAVIQETHEIDIEELPPTNISGLSIQYRNETQEVSHCSSHLKENSPLLRNTQRHGCYEKVKSRFKSRRCCIRSSKAALLILVWNLIVSCGISSFIDPNLYIYNNIIYYIRRVDGTLVNKFSAYNLAFLYGCSAFLFLFYPLAGCLADIRWGRYKTVVNSLCFGFWGVVSVIILGSLTVIGFIPSMVYGIADKMNAIQVTTIATLSIVFGVPIFCGVVLVLCSLIAFSANVIQFGLDQLHDAPTDDSVLYIHWYVWTCYVGVFDVHLSPLIGALSEDAGVLISFVLYFVTITLALSLLGVTLCVQRYKRKWFLIESGFGNPYKLVFKVLKFAKEHSHPVRRSAFTYCEDELPSRLDLGKVKYGGPFTTEEVENVKAFWGILFVLLTLGPIFMTDYAIHGNLQSLASNAYIIYYLNTAYFEKSIRIREIYGSAHGSITSLIIVIAIPLYLGLLRPFIHDYIPGMLKRIGLGMILLLLSGVCTLVMGSVGQHCVSTGNSSSIYVNCENNLFTYFQLNPNLLLIQNFLNALGYMFLYVATYEFICAQSPHSMKGLLIGTFFTVKGVFQLLGVVVLYFPFVYARPFSDQGKFPLHGFIYYVINIVIGMVGIVAFVIVSRRYQYRQRDEPDNIYRYAEEYYAKSQEERNYDYDDYSNLNCETIRE